MKLSWRLEDMASGNESNGGDRVTEALFLAAVVGLTSSCTFAVPLNPGPDLSSTGSKILLTVGAYYSPEFQAYEAEERVGAHGESRFVRPLGQASVPVFDKALSALFENVVRLNDRLPSKQDGSEVALVIEPRIEEVNFGPPNMGIGWGSAVWAEINYGVTIYSAQGTLIGFWKVRGMGETRTQAFRELTVLGRATDQAIEDAVTKFVKGFRDVPEVRRWLREFGVPISGQTQTD